VRVFQATIQDALKILKPIIIAMRAGTCGVYTRDMRLISNTGKHITLKSLERRSDNHGRYDVLLCIMHISVFKANPTDNFVN